MSVQKIHNLIHQTHTLFTQKNLDQALSTAELALDLSNEVNYPKGIIHSNLLLGQIHSTYGHYKGDKSSWPLALECLEKANTLNDSPSGNGVGVDILLAFGNVYQDKKDYDQAEEYFNKALHNAEQKAAVGEQINALCALSQLCINRNEFKAALAYTDRCLELLEHTEGKENKALMAEIYNQLCQVFIKRQEYARILEYSQQLLQISRELGDVEKEVNALKQIAIYHGVKSDYKTAMQYFLDALERSKSINYRYNTAQCLINIATIYAHFFNYRDALERYETVLGEYSDVLGDYTRVIVYNNVGQIHMKNDRPELAEAYFEKALQLSDESRYKEIKALSLAQLSRTKISQKRYEKALADAEAAQQLIETLGDINGRQINLLNLGTIHYHQEKYPKAIRLASQAIVTAKRLKDRQTEIEGYQLLAKIYKDLEDFEKALQYQMIYSQAQEDFSKEQRNRQILDMEIKYAIREQEKEIVQLTKENEFQALLLQQSDQIATQNAQLLQVNEELRQFAYVASHDLKEPLRMIGSYTQLIYKRHKDQFDENSGQYFNFVSEGVVRMNNLLDALLKYATIGKSEEECEEVNLSHAVEMAIINLRLRVEETGAIINCEDLPIVHSIQSLLIQLFQNLISNAIKFRKPDSVPEIFISCKEEEETYLITVKDNGIGIAAEFQERIFIIFQRLHTRAQYDGTGIGLAICQKIVQHLNGQIWVKSEAGEGAAFTFSLPK
ncbi:MAG: tetratricopeptide repeat protein [Bacteroidota bacterium]